MSPRQLGGRRASILIRCALALGLVWGVGAAATDAAWTDVEYATGGFTTAEFVLESSADGSTWADHTADAPAILAFDAAAMYPGKTIAAPLAVRAAAESVAGNVSLVLTETRGSARLIATLKYKIFRDTVAGCSTTATPSSGGEWIAGSASALLTSLGTDVPANSYPVPAGTDGAPGAPVYYCLIVQLPATVDDSLQGLTGSATWEVDGTT